MLKTDSHPQQLFSQAYIIGGSPCSGKSSVAERLVAAHGLRYYKADDHDGEHLQRCQPFQQLVMFKYTKMGWNEIWSQPVAQLLADELAYYCERFPFILDDLRQFALGQPVVLEGAAFLPKLVEALPINRQHVVFMVPTYTFQVGHYSQRSWVQGILSECSNPNQAFEHWMLRDHLFGQEILRQANEYGFPVIQVDGSVDPDEQCETIRRKFGLGV
jgi:2-phosphoglycerate kinase